MQGSRTENLAMAATNISSSSSNSNININSNINSNSNSNSYGNDGEWRELFSRHGKAAMAALSAATFATYPMDMVKTLKQVQSASTAAPVPSLELFRRLRAASGVTGVYRGALWTLSGQVPSLGVRFGTYQLMSAFFQDGRPLPGVSTSEAIKAGALAGALEAVVSTPLELVKVRIQSTHRQALGCGIGLQASGLIDKATSLRPPLFTSLESTIQSGGLQLATSGGLVSQHHTIQSWRPWSSTLWASTPWKFHPLSKTGLENVKDVAQLEGVGTLFRGMRVAMARNALYGSVLFSSWQLVDVGLFFLGQQDKEENRAKAMVRKVAGSMPEWLRTSCAGGVSAGLAAAVSHPLDTATRRLHATIFPKHVRMEKSILRESEPATWLQRVMGITSAHQTRRWSGIGLQVTQHSVGFFCLLAVYHAGLMAL